MSAAGFLWAALAIALCSYGAVRVAGDAVRWLRRRRQAPTPQECSLRYRLGGVTLDYSFPSPVERQAFNEGFREGMEHELMYLQRLGMIKPGAFVDFGPLES